MTRGGYQREEAEQQFIAEELQRISQQPVIDYLASNGDAIEDRVRRCLDQAQSLNKARPLRFGLCLRHSRLKSSR